jgi:predicted nucleic acid-binding protein
LKGYLAANGELIAPSLVISETSGAMARRTGKSQLGRVAVQELITTPSLRLIPVDQSLALVAAELAATYYLRGADAVYVALAYSLNVPLVTWDQEQMTRVQNVVRSGAPGTIFGSNGHSTTPQ